MNNISKADSIIQQIAINKMMEDLLDLAHTIRFLSQKYAFLFNENEVLTKDILLKGLHSEGKSLFDDENNLVCSPAYFLDAIEPETKELIFNSLIEKLAQNVSLDGLKNMKNSNVEGD